MVFSKHVSVNRKLELHPHFWFQMKKSKYRIWPPLPAERSWPWKGPWIPSTCPWPCSPSSAWAKLLPAFMDPSRPTPRSESWLAELSSHPGRSQMSRCEWSYHHLFVRIAGCSYAWRFRIWKELKSSLLQILQLASCVCCRSSRTSGRSRWWWQTRPTRKIVQSDFFARLQGNTETYCCLLEVFFHR